MSCNENIWGEGGLTENCLFKGSLDPGPLYLKMSEIPCAKKQKDPELPPGPVKGEPLGADGTETL